MTYLQHKNLKPGLQTTLWRSPSNVYPDGRVVRAGGTERKPGKPSKLSVEDQVLMSLEYWREYRTYSILVSHGST